MELPKPEPTPIGEFENLGELFAHRATLGKLRKIARLQDGGNEGAAKPRLLDTLLAVLISKPDDAELSENELQKVSSDDRARMIAALLDSQPPRVPRDDGEADAGYLERSWQTELDDMAKMLKDIASSFSTKFAGLNPALTAAIRPDFLENSMASKRLFDLASSMRVGLTGNKALLANVNRIFGSGESSNAARLLADSGMARDADKANALDGPGVLGSTHFKMPPNPSVKTNKILEKMAQQTADMYALAAETALMQRSMNSISEQILADFGKAVEASKITSKENSTLSRIGLGIAIAALTVSVLSARFQYYSQTKQDVQNQEATKALIASEKGLSASFDRVAKAEARAESIAPPAPPPKAKAPHR